MLSNTLFEQRCATIDVDGNLVSNLREGVLKKSVTDFLDEMSAYCGVDIFLLGPKPTPMVDGLSGDVELRMDQRWRVAIYGDALSAEHAKTRVLIHIDQLVRRSGLTSYCVSRSANMVRSCNVLSTPPTLISRCSSSYVVATGKI